MWTSVLAYLILREPIHKTEIAAILICFSAVVLISQSKSGETTVDGVTFLMYQLGILAISYTAFGFGIVGVFTRKMKEMHFSVILFWYSLFGAVTLGGYILIRDLFFTLPTENNIFSYPGYGYLLSLGAAVANAIG
jgi:drug/metabolite transporter (DMT)-like permease